MNWPCPITGGAVTRMGAASFASACKIRKDTKDNNTCKQCKGRREHWPPELEVIEMASSKSKETVADVLGPLKEKAEMLDRVAGIFGWSPNEDMAEAATRMIGALDSAVLDLRGKEREVERLQAELEEARRIIADQSGEVSAARRERADLLDVGAAVYRDALADFGASVLAGRVLVTFRDAP